MCEKRRGGGTARGRCGRSLVMCIWERSVWGVRGIRGRRCENRCWHGALFSMYKHLSQPISSRSVEHCGARIRRAIGKMA